jgi:DNA-binding transcriptional regulator GbsR (MarR family)
MAKIYNENLEYYYSFTGNFAEAYKDDIQNSLEMLHSLQMLATQNNQDKLAKQMESVFNREASKFKQ